MNPLIPTFSRAFADVPWRTAPTESAERSPIEVRLSGLIADALVFSGFSLALRLGSARSSPLAGQETTHELLLRSLGQASDEELLAAVRLGWEASRRLGSAPDQPTVDQVCRLSKVRGLLIARRVGRLL